MTTAIFADDTELLATGNTIETATVDSKQLIISPDDQKAGVLN